MKIKVGLELFVLNIGTHSITKTVVEEIGKYDLKNPHRFIGYYESMVILKQYKHPIRLKGLFEHLTDKRRKKDNSFVGEEIFAYSNIRVFIALTEKEVYEHLAEIVIPYDLIHKEIEAQGLLSKHNKLIDGVGDLARKQAELREKIKEL